MKTSLRFISMIVLLIARAVCAQVTFSEIMFDVATNEYHDEFVELFNLSFTDTLNINGWTFSDSSGVDGLIPFRGGEKISPRSYAVILDGSYATNSQTYEEIIPDTVTILTITDNSFGKNGLSNTMAESLSICDSLGNILCGYRYSIGNRAGFSDEKIDPDGGDAEENWGNSQYAGGTPGWRNSLSPRRIDFGFEDSGVTLPVFSFRGDSIPVEIVVSMFGQQVPEDSLLIQVFSFFEDDPDPQLPDRLLYEKWFPAGPIQFFTRLTPLPTGRHSLTFQVSHPLDENGENDQLTAGLDIYSRDHSLHLNEIKFLVPAEEPEWIELVNSGNERIPLRGWAVSDLTDTVQIDTAVYLGAGEFLVIAGDRLPNYYRSSTENLLILRNFPVLNDAGDEISLIDPLGAWQERITYSRNWLEGEDFRSPSLERINPSLDALNAANWGPCVNTTGGTPAAVNSIFSEIIQSAPYLRAAPDPFSPDGDGIDDVTIISGEIALSNARIIAQIFDINGRLIQTLRDNRFNGNQINLVWDGKDSDNRPARIGIYLVFVQVLNDRNGILKEMKTTVILAQKL